MLAKRIIPCLDSVALEGDRTLAVLFSPCLDSANGIYRHHIIGKPSYMTASPKHIRLSVVINEYLSVYAAAVAFTQ